MKDPAVLDQAERWLASGHKVALATVVRTWGSAPRPAGSQLAINDGGAFVGSVSGGCVEGAVAAEARLVLADGKPRLISFGVTNDQAWQVGLACGGKIDVFVEVVS
jgi:xanthine/CO dehydrogenase XdhC/CoxF family maturation factor